MAGSYYCRSSDILSPTWTRESGGATVSGYVPSLLGQFVPWSPRPFKASSGTVTLRATFGGATLVEALSIHGPHSLGGVSVGITSQAGLSTTLTPGADTLDDHSTSAFKDLRAQSGITATYFEVVISGAPANVVINKIVLWGTVRTMRSRWGLREAQKYNNDKLETELDSPLIYETRTRRRPWSTTVILESERDDMLALHAAARGDARPWPLVPDTTEQDCLLARFVNPRFGAQRDAPGRSPMDISVEEYGLGQALV
jgi:hypothetical protein